VPESEFADCFFGRIVTGNVGSESGGGIVQWSVCQNYLDLFFCKTRDHFQLVSWREEVWRGENKPSWVFGVCEEIERRRKRVDKGVVAGMGVLVEVVFNLGDNGLGDIVNENT